MSAPREQGQDARDVVWALEAENERLREALREYASHQSWRCEYPPHFYLVEPVPEGECACGLNRTLRELGLLEASSEPRP